MNVFQKSVVINISSMQRVSFDEHKVVNYVTVVRKVYTHSTFNDYFALVRKNVRRQTGSSITRRLKTKTIAAWLEFKIMLI